MQIVFNWHLTERCNFACKYCFAKWSAGKELWRDPNQVRALFRELQKAPTLVTNSGFKSVGAVKGIRINFVGGEPLVLGEHLERSVKFALDHGFAISIVTNGSLLRKSFGIVPCLETLGLSIDSFSAVTNRRIGRCSQGGETVSYEVMQQSIDLARGRNGNIRVKTNTVVNRFNWKERPFAMVRKLNPDKIKIFRQLPFQGMQGVSDAMFRAFLERNEIGPDVCIEDNEDMIESYLMIDPAGRLFQNGNGVSYAFSRPVQEVGLSVALDEIRFDFEKFTKRYQGN